ncbi:MAG: glycosyltransferase family 2 protein [Hyphomonadaceae bacterium]
MGPAVSIVIPTFRRPERAVEAVRSALAQVGAPDFEIVVVDNDPAGSALPRLEALALAEDRIPIRVLHAPDPGVAHARNRALAAVRGDWIAFLDDDETATPGWLAELLRVQDMTGADVVFGPVLTRLPFTPSAHGEFYEAFFARAPDHAEGLIDETYGCGNSLIRRSALPDGGEAPFSIAHNETGGEDDVLFQRMRLSGKRFAWASAALALETPEPSRVNLGYTLRRAFAYGQGPAHGAWREGKPLRTLAWMGVGAVQAAVFGLGSLAGFVLRSRRRAFAYARTAEGLGKIFWPRAFEPKFYGAAALPRPVSAKPASAR